VSRGASITASGRKIVSAFEVEIENFWVDRLSKVEVGKSKAVWLTPRWRLVFQRQPLSVRVGGSEYDKRVTLADFRADCFEALQETR
jgi:hypothetical protein